MLDEVVIASSDEEAAGVVAAANEANGIRAAQFSGEILVVDLRGTAVAPAHVH